ncbi:hypothetical protein NQZ68_008597 [Dissostichus eleginoides]|nr:hypothetical protein NQZ68_008597 [Dissostichus eleginoides]
MRPIRKEMEGTQDVLSTVSRSSREDRVEDLFTGTSPLPLGRVSDITAGAGACVSISSWRRRSVSRAELTCANSSTLSSRRVYLWCTDYTLWIHFILELTKQTSFSLDFGRST